MLRGRGNQNCGDKGGGYGGNGREWAGVKQD